MSRRVVGFSLLLFVTATGGSGAGLGLSGSPVPDRGTPGWLDIDSVRGLAGNRDLPSQLDAVVVGVNRGPGLAVTPWGGLQTVELPVVALRVSYTDGRTVLIDAGPDEQTLAEMSSSATWSAQGWERQLQWLDEADWVVVTHEHLDHASGLVQHPRFDTIAPQIRLTAAQRSSIQVEEAGFTQEVLSKIPDFDYAELTQLTPGIVLIQAPGHTPGSQVIYIRMPEAELLLVGDIAWDHYGISAPIQKPRLVSYGILGEDTTAIGGQLMRLHEVEVSHPEIHQVVAHDAEDWAQLAEEGVLTLHADL